MSAAIGGGRVASGNPRQSLRSWRGLEYVMTQKFFITTATPQHLNNHHTIFGEVVKGYDVVEKISHVQTSGGDRPVKDVVIKSIEISDKGPALAAPAPAPAPAKK